MVHAKEKLLEEKEAKLINTARLVNESKPDFVIEKINQAVDILNKKRSEIKICCLGLSFKPNIDDLRESPALFIAQKVSMMGFKKQYLVEPNIDKMPEILNTKKANLVDLETAINNSDIVVLLVDHSLFKELDLGLLLGKQLIDTRGSWNFL